MYHNLQITEKQALVIAKRIHSSSYGTFIRGNYDLYTDELAKVIMLSVNANTDGNAKKELDKYYRRLLDEKEYA